MSPERRSPGEQAINPLSVARASYTRLLFAEDAQGLISGITHLENELRRSGVVRPQMYAELSSSAEHGIARARMLEGDASPTAALLEGMRERFDESLQHPTAASQPTPTESLPMSGAKGAMKSPEPEPTKTRKPRTPRGAQKPA